MRQQTLIAVIFGMLMSFAANETGMRANAHFRHEIRKLHYSHQLNTEAQSRLLARSAHGSAEESFPDFECAIQPFGFSPYWGAMQSTKEMQRTFCEMPPDEFVPAPNYDMRILQQSLDELNKSPRTDQKMNAITSKLFYSRRFLGEENLDSDEFAVNAHPALDIRMPEGTPVRSLAGGKVHRVDTQENGLGNYVVIEHRLPSTNERVFSVYGHLASANVKAGINVRAGQFIGTVGNTGDSTNPHLHLQIDRGSGVARHEVYSPPTGTARAEIVRNTIHPIEFIRNY